ncbi:acylphosphatase [Candidatus Woesearchaeota archaeon]|nr:acylphosphatase [Candidatus Woesearchaeota archaeon]
MRRVRVLVSGFVQGVFFRAFIKNEADKLGLKCYAKNMENGNVEAVIEGHEFKVKMLLEKCKTGPAGSQVENIKIFDEPFQNEFKSFKIKY